MSKARELLNLIEDDGNYIKFKSVGDPSLSREQVELAIKEMLPSDVEFDRDELTISDTKNGLEFSYPKRFLDPHLFDIKKYPNLEISLS